jgi:hypothetical protein
MRIRATATNMFLSTSVNQMHFSFWGIGVNLPPSAKIFTEDVCSSLLSSSHDYPPYVAESPRDGQSLIELFMRRFTVAIGCQPGQEGTTVLELEYSGKTFWLSVEKLNVALEHLEKICLDSDAWVGGDRPDIAALFFLGIKKIFKESGSRVALNKQLLRLEELRKAALKESKARKLAEAA